MKKALLQIEEVDLEILNNALDLYKIKLMEGNYTQDKINEIEIIMDKLKKIDRYWQCKF